MNELWQAILAQTTLDAVHWCKSKGERDYPWGRRANPSRLKAFQAWRWCIDPRYIDDREMICEACGQDPRKWERAFGEPGWRIYPLQKWAKAVLRQ